MKSFTAVLLAVGRDRGALVVALPAGAAGNAGSTQVTTFDPTGATFPCTNGTTYTVTGGTVRSIFHQSGDATGGGHVTGTISPIGVTLSDGTTNTVLPPRRSVVVRRQLQRLRGRRGNHTPDD
jgi:hypothetical protein